MYKLRSWPVQDNFINIYRDSKELKFNQFGHAHSDPSNWPTIFSASICKYLFEFSLVREIKWAIQIIENTKIFIYDLLCWKGHCFRNHCFVDKFQCCNVLIPKTKYNISYSDVFTKLTTNLLILDTIIQYPKFLN